MARYHLSTTHLWSEQQVSIGGRTFFHRQCQICRGGFARSLDNGEWDSVHVGFLSFNFLDDEITQRWVTENCPGGPLLREANSKRLEAGGEVYDSSSKLRANSLSRT